jgi:putative flippase GtrA
MTREFGRFLMVGAANTLLAWGVYWIALHWLPYHGAFALSFVAAVAFSALAHSRLSFGVRLRAGGLAAYSAYAVAMYVLSAGALEAVVTWLQISATWANIVVTAVTVPANFVGARWVMRSHAVPSA